MKEFIIIASERGLTANKQELKMFTNKFCEAIDYAVNKCGSPKDSEGAYNIFYQAFCKINEV